MMQPMSEYFYGESEKNDQEHLNLHSIALDDGEASFPAPEEVRSSSTSRNRYPVTKPKSKKRYFWIASIVALMMVVIMVPAIVISRGRKDDSDNKQAAAKAATEPPRPRPSLESVVDYFVKEGISDAALLKDKNTPQFKAAQWLASEDVANIVIPPFETRHMDGYFYAFRYVMALTYFATGGENWFLDHKFLSGENVCRWNTGNVGVLCYNFEGMVVPVEVILSSNNLHGEIPKELGKLFTIRGLNLGVNLLTGGIPNELCQLRDLRYLVLNHNSLGGSVPSCTGTLDDLDELILSDNLLQGALPTELGKLSKLESLYIDDNRLSGDPAPVLNQLGNLTHLMASRNMFASDIDDSFLAMNQRLTWLDLSHNNFTGTGFFPEHLVKPSLNVLDLSRNKLSFHFPATLTDNTALWYLSLYQNKITGPLDALSGYKGLVHLDVSNNEIFGSMEAIGSLTQLEVLFLSENPFTAGPVPSSLANLARLTELSLRNTNRNGALPEIAPMVQLVDFGSNSLVGTIPSTYGSRHNLTLLLLNKNAGLQGELPSTFDQLSELRAVFLDGTGLQHAMDVLCQLQAARPVPRGEVLVADCTACSCQGCTCCTVKGGCSLPDLDNQDVSWETDFQRQKFSLLDYTSDSGLGYKPPIR